MNTDEIRMLLHAANVELTRLKEVEKQLLKERGELLADRRRLEWLFSHDYLSIPVGFPDTLLLHDRAAIDAAMNHKP
jgi:hypothetical protein